MTKLVLYLASTFLVSMSFLLVICRATTYTVGDSSGWDISTDLDSWASNKTFYVGDVLSFQYSSSNSVEEVDKDSFDNCNTTDTLQTFTNDNGNTTVPLTRPGGWYFTSGNRLYCLGGMKLQLNAITNTTSIAQSPSLPPQPSSKSDNPNTITPTSSSTSIHKALQIHYLFSVVSLMYTSFVLLHI